MWHDINERNPRYVSPRLKSLGTPTLGLNLVELRGMNGYAPAWLVARPKAARDRAFARAILERPHGGRAEHWRGTTGIQHQTPLAPAYIFLAPLRRHWRVQDILTKGAAVPHRYYWHSATRRPLGTTTQLRPATAGTAAAPQIMVLISGKFEKNPSIGVSPLAIAGSLSGFTERGHCQSLGAAVTCEPHIMHSLKPKERRGSVRRHLYNIVKMQIGADTAPRECLILDISDEGVRLHIVGFDVPDQFVLLLSGDNIVQESIYKVIWRRGREVGAKFVSFSSVSTQLK